MFENYQTVARIGEKTIPEKPKPSKLLKKFPAFYGTRTLITVFTTARHLLLS
jgi:hypothetical protein